MHDCSGGGVGGKSGGGAGSGDVDRSGLPRAAPRPLTAAERALVVQAFKVLPRAVAHYSRLREASGLGDPDDAASHVGVVFMQRLQGQHPFDPARSSLKNYLFMLTRSVLSNQACKARYRGRVLDALAPGERERVAELDIEALEDCRR